MVKHLLIQYLIGYHENCGILYFGNVSIEKCNKAEIVLILYEKQQLKQRNIGKELFTLICDELPRVDYITIYGKAQERVDLTIYTYIP